MACRLNLDYSHVDELAAHNCPEIRGLAFGLRGMMKLVRNIEKDGDKTFFSSKFKLRNHL